MSDSSRVCVVDANILIDLHAGELLREFFRLPLRPMVPDVVLAELDIPDRKSLLSYGLEEVELSPAQVQMVVTLLGRYHRPSTNDLFALCLAREWGATLLTGDHHLRDAAVREGVKVHGTLWVLDELVRLGIVVPCRAAQSLEQMRASGGRLPTAECEKRLLLWRA